MESAKMQLLHYLNELEEQGICRGYIISSEEKKRKCSS